MRTPTILGVLLAGGIALAGCSPSEVPSDQPATPGTPPPQSAIVPAGQDGPKAPNQVDPKSVDHEFAQQLLSHDQVANELTGLAKRGSEDEEIKRFADKVDHAQQPVVNQAKSWVTANLGPNAVQAASEPAVGTNTWMPPSNPNAVTALEKARGEAFEKTFTDSTYEHLDQMVQMGEAELAHGTDPQMRSLAQRVVDTNKPLREQVEELGKSVG